MNITRMSNEKPAPDLELIEPTIEQLKAKHANYLYLLKQKFYARTFKAVHTEQHTNNKTERLTMTVLLELEDYIAAKSQLLSNLQGTDEFYEIQAEQLDIAKNYFVEIYEIFTHCQP